MLQNLGRAALVCLTIAGLTGCGGGGKTPASAVATTTSDSNAVATAIESRLQAAGYTIEALPLSGSLNPRPASSFKVEADFASPRSFTLEVLVFGSPRAAALFEEKANAQCNRIAACKKARLQARTHTGQRVVGAAAYSAYTDYNTATLPVKNFEKLVALASGRSSGP